MDLALYIGFEAVDVSRAYVPVRTSITNTISSGVFVDPVKNAIDPDVEYDGWNRDSPIRSRNYVQKAKVLVAVAT